MREIAPRTKIISNDHINIFWKIEELRDNQHISTIVPTTIPINPAKKEKCLINAIKEGMFLKCTVMDAEWYMLFFDNEVKFAETVTGINVNDDLEKLSEAKNGVNTSLEYGELERQKLDVPDKESVPTTHSLEYEAEKDKIIEQNELDRLNVESARLNNNETGEKINEGGGELKEKGNDVDGVEGTKEKASGYVEKSLDIIDEALTPDEIHDVKEYAKGEVGVNTTSSYSYETQKPDNTVAQPSGVNTTELYDLPVEDGYNQKPSIGSQSEPVVSNEKQDETITPSTQGDNGDESSHIQNRLNELSEHVIDGLSEKLDELKDDLFDGIQNHNK